METSDGFNIDLISKSLNEIQAEKGRNERLLHTENSRRVNREFELQTNFQKRKEVEKKHLETIKELATLKNKCGVLDKQHDELMAEHYGYRDEIDALTVEENTKELEHKQTMAIYYKLLDEILAKFRNTKSVLISEFKEKGRSDLAREVSLLEAEFETKKTAIENMQKSIETYEEKMDKFRKKEEALREDYSNFHVLEAHFVQELQDSEKCERESYTLMSSES